jgi:hypothetical protein
MDEPEASRLQDTQPSAAQRRTQPTEASDAYRRALELTEREPSNPVAWIDLAAAAVDLQIKVASLNRALAIDGGNLRARQGLHDALVQLLKRDPRLEYLGETSSLYRVRSAEKFEFTHPKDRAESQPPAAGGTAQRRLYGWLKWALVGMIPAGLGTLFFGPLVALEAAAQLRQPVAGIERRRIWAAAVLGAALWLVALVPLVILLLHII